MLMGSDCPEAFETFGVVNDSSQTVVYHIEASGGDGPLESSRREIPPGDEHWIRTFPPCRDNPAFLTTPEGEEIAIYTPEEDCDTRSLWVVQDDEVLLVTQDEYDPAGSAVTP